MFIRLMRRVVIKLQNLFVDFVCIFPYFKFIKETRETQVPIFFSHWFNQKILGKGEAAYWPVSTKSLVSFPRNIFIGIETSPGYMPGCYIQGMGKIYIGDYTQIAPNVGIISGNHELTDNRKHILKEVRIGKYCWLAMGSLIMPGVTLGDYTVVAAGSVVTKSFPEGYCVIGGNPAKKIKDIDPAECVLHKSKYEYNGYIPAAQFDAYRKKHLNVDAW